MILYYAKRSQFLTHINDVKCPSCGQISLTPSKHDSVDAIACQNIECRAIIDRNGKKVGIWVENNGRLGFQFVYERE